MDRSDEHSKSDDDDALNQSDHFEPTEQERSVLLEDLNLDDVESEEQSSATDVDDTVVRRKNIEHDTPEAAKKSSIKSPSTAKTSSEKKRIHFNLEPSECVRKSQSQGRSQSPHEPSPKKRKKEVRMPEIINEMEEELERQWVSNKEKLNLTVLNVKNIIRSVMTNKYVVDMVRQTVEEGGVTDVPFGPKLTRAKTKELLQQHNDAPLPPVVGFLTPIKSAEPEIDPKIKCLLDETELSEETSDEEYDPAKDNEQSDEEKGNTSVASDLDSLPATPASLPAPLTPLQDVSQDGMFKVPQENVGQRTRSKLNLNRLPLESIEQAFVPPDVTQDMYEQECDNPDWHQFLKEFTQPLSLNETVEDDVDNDPEYNILEDEEVEDKEEMRKDRAVKVSKRELNALMAELFDYTDNLSSDDDTMAQTTETIAALEQSILQETEEREKREEIEREGLRHREQVELQQKKELEEKQKYGIHPHQRQLLNQQLRQHVQLITQHFLQTFNHPLYNEMAVTCKTMLTTLQGLKDSKVCCQDVDLTPTMVVVNDWEKLHAEPETGQRIQQFVKRQLEEEKRLRSSRKNANMDFPPELMRLVLESEAFPYPSLLPPHPFRTTLEVTGQYSFTPSENMLLALCLEQVTQLMESNPEEYRKRRVCNRVNLIYEMTMPRSTPRSIATNIRRLKSIKQQNPIKSFFETGKAPMILHYVIPVEPGFKLCHHSADTLPPKWKHFMSSQNSNTDQLPPTLFDKETQSQIELPYVKSLKEIRNQYKPTKLPKKIAPKTLRSTRRSNMIIDKTTAQTNSTNSTHKHVRAKNGNALFSDTENNSQFNAKPFRKLNCSSVKIPDGSDCDVSVDSNNVRRMGKIVKNNSSGSSENTSAGYCEHSALNKNDSSRNEVLEKQIFSTSIVTTRSSKVRNFNSINKDAVNCEGTNSLLPSSESLKNCVANGDLRSLPVIPYINGIEESSISQSSSEALTTRSKNNIKSSSSFSHKPKPPSTVKLKEPDLTAKYNSNREKTKVPTSRRQTKPVLDPNR